MKFSVLLPTRNRLELLKYAIETVRRQDYNDWEIIVSDNYSEEDISGYIQSLREPRIKYYRTDSFVPVTDNWNNALANSSGDYVIMLGDDDCLMRGFFRTVKGLIETYDRPDFIYSNSYVYAYPGVLPDSPDGFLKLYNFAPFFRSAQAPFWLSKKESLNLVRQSMNFKMTFTYNMQHSIISRNVIKSLSYKGNFFQSPYPDFYATNVLLLKAKRILICPSPLVTIGISPKSFGFYSFNDRDVEGNKFLNNLADPASIKRLEDVIIPSGPQDRTSWLIAMDTIKTNYGSESKLHVNYNRYRYLQILNIFGKYKKGSDPQIAALRSQLRLWELILYIPPIWLATKLTKLVPHGVRSIIVNKIMGIILQTPKIDTSNNKSYYRNILEVFEKVNPLGNQ